MASDEDFSAPLPFLKCLCFLTFNLAWLVIGCVLYGTGTSQYSMVIEHETAEWNKAPIEDFLATRNSQCPSGYEMVTGTFPGTKTFCASSYSVLNSKPWLGDGYKLGACSKNKKGYTVYGIGETRLN